MLRLVEGWVVNLLANEGEEISECFLVSLADVAFSECEVNFCEVHADSLRNHPLHQGVDEIHFETIAFVSTGGEELAGVNAVDVEGDPVLGEVWSVFEVRMDLLLDGINLLDLTFR